jgi:opacity protein-like surface antigen
MKPMKILLVAATLAAASADAGRAVAQPDDDDDPTSVDDEDPLKGETETDDSVGDKDLGVAEPTPPPTPDAPPPPPAPPPAPRPSRRPAGHSMGIGVGYLMPTAIDTPNLASARFRLANGIIFEPRLELETASQSYEAGTTETSDDVTTLGVSGMVLYPLRARGALDFLITGGLYFERVSEDPDGSNNNRTDTTLGLTWGLGINYWLSAHWSASFLATNPLLAWTSSTEDSLGGEATTTTFGIGADFDPGVSVMIHLFY